MICTIRLCLEWICFCFSQYFSRHFLKILLKNFPSSLQINFGTTYGTPLDDLSVPKEALYGHRETMSPQDVLKEVFGHEEF